jgi:hypothetical protein
MYICILYIYISIHMYMCIYIYIREYRAAGRLLLKSNTSALIEGNEYMKLYRNENKAAVSGYNRLFYRFVAFCYICGFLFFMWLFAFTYALLASLRFTCNEDRFLLIPTRFVILV